MGIHRTPKSGLFLLEMVILILFFSIASAICVNLFVKAHVLSTQSRDLGTAVQQVQTVAETYKAVNGDTSQMTQLLALAEEDGGKLALYYNKEWQIQQDSNDAVYTLTVVPVSNQGEDIVGAKIAVIKNDDKTEEIFAVDVKKYIG
ncbi:MAG: hypothetical protein VB100_07345 [Angelakisella sp.]|nr:hypothetical protein [Angelakisella sp.]